jgi:LmbE family N-acetylglucosaminyl deacetylase
MQKIHVHDRGNAGIRVLCLGAHSDDIEIGCGGLLLRLIEQRRRIHVDWVVFSAAGRRGAEARISAKLFLRGSYRSKIHLHGFRDGFFPYHGAEIKQAFERLKHIVSPDLVLTHYREDRHQDHRVLSDLTWNTFRDHWILEYEIPKFDGDLGSPNIFAPLDSQTTQKKVKYLERSFGSQRDKPWFNDDTFLGLMRLRGMECRAPAGFAEAFYSRKAVLQLDAIDR